MTNVWVETHRPKSLKETILPQRIRENMASIVESGSIPNLLFTGSAGIGKTTLARALAADLGYDVLVVNCSDEGRLLDTFRNKVASFCTSISIDGNRKLLVLDEIDNLTHDVQSLLRGFLEKHMKNCSFIATCNFPAKLMEPVRSRFAEVDFNIRGEEKKEVIKGFFDRTTQILTQEGVAYDRKDVAETVGKFFPDFRRTLNELQRYGATGAIDSGIFAGLSGDLEDLIGFVREGRWNEMRKWVAENASTDFTVLARSLYNKAGDFMKRDSHPQFVVLIAEYDFKMAFVKDKEVAAVAFLTQVMAECEML